MFFDLCNNYNDTAVELVEICLVNSYNIFAAIITIILIGLFSTYLFVKYKLVCNELFYLHNQRSACGFILIIVNLCEIGEAIVANNGVVNGYVARAPPLSCTVALISMAVFIGSLGFVRLIEVRDKPAWLYLTIIIQGILLVPRIYKYVNTPESKQSTELQPFLLITTIILLVAICVLDAFTLYKEQHSSKPKRTPLQENANVGYKHPHATFLSKITYWWLTPLLWKGYWDPLELQDLGTLYEENTSRFQYDQFLFIYQNFKNKQIPLWLCYFKSCWKMFLVGGILKFFGDLAGLIGPLSITQIVEYIEMKTNTTTEIAVAIENNNPNENTIYYPSWNDFLSNGWIISILVLFSSIAQGTLSQGSTHIVNMIGIRLKTSIQGIVYRKTLCLSSSCFYTSNIATNNTNNENDDSIKSRDEDDGGGDDDGDSTSNRNDNDDGDDDDVQVGQRERNEQQFDNNENENKNDGEKNLENNVTDAGAITNLMSEDAFNVMSFFWIAHYVWAIPLKIAVVMYLLYQKLGVSAIIGSVFCIIIMTPLQFLIGKMMSTNGKKASECTDERLKKLNEVLLGIKIIKLNAWEKVFKEKILDMRLNELKMLDKDSVYWTAMTILTHISSVLITFVTLTVYTNIETEGTRYEFTAGRLFSALALFNQLTVPLFIFPITVPIIIAATVSTKRLEKFLQLPEVKKEFEGVQNMARILCRSDASLDIFENEKEPSTFIETDEASSISQFSTSDINGGSVGNDYSCNNLTLIIESSIDDNLTTMDEPATLKIMKQPLAHSISNDLPSKSNTIKLKKNNQLSMGSKIERNRNRPKSVKVSGGGGGSGGGGVVGSGTQDPAQLTYSDDLIVEIRNAKFSWSNNSSSGNNKNETDFEILLKVNKMEIPKGKFTIIVGKNGAGKSSLLAALLKEMHLKSGEVYWNKYATTAYVPQIPWLMNTTIRDNILFGESYRPKRYDRVLEACSLKPDIELMPGGDLTEIGERGINLSGGQRQRIAIARAIYSSANVVIMDDALSSLDNEVGNFIIEKCIKKMLLRYRRTVILVTQKISLINIADYIVAMENNDVRSCGTLKEIENNDPILTQEWNSIIIKENAREIPLSPGRTARERWKLFKNVSRIGLQRTNATEEDELSSSQSIYLNLKRRSSFYGSRHLTCDIPLPIDECQIDDVDLRRRPSRRNPFVCNSLDLANSKNVLRVNSLQVNSPTRSQDRLPVIRNVSSPISLTYGVKTSGLNAELQTSPTHGNRMGFRQFLRRLSTRRTSNVGSADFSSIYRERKRLHRPISASDSIRSIDEEDDNPHQPIEKLMSTISKYSEEVEDECGSNYNEEISNRLISDEERKYGKIPTRIYMLYLKSCGLYIVSIFFLSAFGWQALRVYTDVWLKDWTDNKSSTEENDKNQIFYYFKIYGILSGVCILFTMISTPAGQMAGCRARRIIHNKLLDSILRNSLHFFQVTPVGRILNRFSNDMGVIDKKIAATSQRLLQFILLCLCAILINTAITPWFIILTVPICAVYYVIQRFYRSSSRELQRIESITSSPILSHFSETIQGVTTIRAFNQEARFMEILFKRMEANNIAFIILNTSNRWLGIGLDYLGGIIVFVAIITALFTSHLYPNEAIPSLIGLAINYTLLVPIYLNWVVKLLSDMEMYIGAVERVHHYIENENRQKVCVYKTVPISWPQKGDIVFENVSLKYENQKENIISNFNLTIPAGQRIGICGRTGSGKSSLALSLFGVLNITDGRILIDDVDISNIHVDELRSRLSIIPQDVILFKGTVRENLDPRGHFSDLDLWNCLETAQLKDIIKRTGLDTEIAEGGLNLSVGRRQLFCLARAVLRGSACLVLDEATSSLDSATERELIEAADKAFQGRTIITIAHRLTTLLNYDRIIVIDQGKIVEDGDPKILKNKSLGKFSAMLKSSNAQMA